MGVLISSGKVDVLIDGLHEYYGPEYLHTPGTEIQSIMAQTGPYSKLRIATFTHYHRDHYSAGLASSFLKVSRDNRVIGSPQVIDSLSKDRTIDAWNRNGVAFRDTAARFTIESFNIPHVSPQRHSKVQNVAYVVQTAGIKILHIGDAERDTVAFSRFRNAGIDVLVSPIWFLTSDEGRRIILDIIKPRTVIATHISPRETQSLEHYRLPGMQTHFFSTINQAVKVL